MLEVNKIKSFISASPQGTIFSTPEWLEAVAPGSWQYILVKEEENIKLCMPIILSNRMGFKLCNMPPLTQSLGMLFPAKEEGKYSKILSNKTNDMLELISKIPKNSYFKQRFHPTINNWLPFYWNNYTQTTKYTYIINDLTNTEYIWKEFNWKKRQEIRKAKSKLEISETQDFEALKYCINSIHKRQKKNIFNFQVLERIFNFCNERNCGKIFLATTRSGDIAGSVFIVWDQKTAYYLAGAGSEPLRNSGAIPLLLWHSIKFSSSVTKEFNFEGSMIRPIEYFFRSFGGKLTPYYEITKINSSLIKLYKNFSIL